MQRVFFPMLVVFCYLIGRYRKYANPPAPLFSDTPTRLGPQATESSVHSEQLRTPEGQRLLAAVRVVASRLAEVEEVIDGFGHATFKVRRKSFVIAGMGEDGAAVSIKSDPATQAHLIRRRPYYRTPYIGQHGWVSIADPLSHDWAEVEELIRDAYRLAAPKTLARRVR